MQLDHIVLSGIMYSIPTTGFHLKRWGSLFREDSSNWIPLDIEELSLAFVRQNAVGLGGSKERLDMGMLQIMMCCRVD